MNITLQSLAGVSFISLSYLAFTWPLKTYERSTEFDANYKSDLKKFMLLNKHNKIVKTWQELEKQNTYGGLTEDDPYVAAFNKIII